MVEWIDRMQKRSPNQRWGVWGGVIGMCGGLAGAWLGVALGALNYSPNSLAFWIPLMVIGIIAGGMTYSTLKQVAKDQTAWSRESRGLMMRLIVARWHGSLKETLGEEGAKTLNDAAAILLHCQATLDTPAWKAVAGSELWNTAREKSLRAMDSAMARLVMLVLSGAQASEAGAILADMRAMNEEVAKAAQRHSTVAGIPLEGSEGLRQALADLRELSSADEEYLEDRLR